MPQSHHIENSRSDLPLLATGQICHVHLLALPHASSHAEHVLCDCLQIEQFDLSNNNFTGALPSTWRTVIQVSIFDQPT